MVNIKQRKTTEKLPVLAKTAIQSIFTYKRIIYYLVTSLALKKL